VAEPLYLPPSKEDALLQGDIYKKVPIMWIGERPLLVARHAMTKVGREFYSVHKEFVGESRHPAGDAPKKGFRWTNRDTPELLLVPAVLSIAMVMTHDCEIENDPDHRVLAMIRPITDLEPDYRKKCLAHERVDMFPLEAQEEAPSMVTSFVDFRKFSPLRSGALEPPAERYASASEVLRKAVARAYWNYLHHPFQAPRPPMNG
jgi:hypothetical protein